MSGWKFPNGLVGRPDVVRVFSGSARNTGCPAKLALKARINVRLREPRPYKPEKLETFFLAPLMGVLDLTEHEDLDLDHALDVLAQPNLHQGLVREYRLKPVHPGVLAWASHAARSFMRAWPADDCDLRPIRGNWVDRHRLRLLDQRGARRYELHVWGRGYESSDGEVREIRLPTTRAGRKPRSEAELAVIAGVLANGEAQFSHRADTPTLPRQVRIVEIGCADGSVEMLYERSRDEAIADFANAGRAALGAAVDGSDFQPGQDCVDCKYSPLCPALPQVPGVLGISDITRPRRSWSVTNGRRYRSCPAQDHFRRVQLPRALDVEYGPSASRGRVLHEWLRQRHSRRPLVPCSTDSSGVWAASSGSTLPDEEKRLVERFISLHAKVCPLRHLANDSGTKVEETLVFDDGDADVALIVEPDLLYEDRGAWVWREVKTTAKEVTLTHARLLHDYPQLALAVALLSRNALGGRLIGSRVELEVLSPAGAGIEILDPMDPVLRETATKVLNELTRQWHGDDEFPARPGKRCVSCEVARWCPSAEDGR